MQTLDKHNFHQIYYKTRNEIYRDFYKPCLESSIKYDRITGYFGSSVFLVIKDALKDFVQNNGKIRIVCSPIITDEDYDAIISGYFKSLDSSSNKFNEVIDEMSKQYPKTTTLLSNLISLGILEIKMAVFGDNPLAFKLLHDKVGLFHDVNGNTVSFGGSINETYKGVSEFGNSEVFEVNTSWGDASEIKRVSIYKERFNNIWRGDEKGIHTFEIPKVTKDKFRALSNDKNVRELIDEVTIELGHIDEKSPRIDIQYSDLVLGEVAKIGVLHCSSLNDVVIELVDDHKILVLDNDKHTIQAISYGNQKIVLKSNYTNQTLDEREITVIRWAAEPGLNRRKIRNYQETILDNWVKNNRVGIFEMATGSGKTFTAFCAIRDAIYLHDQIPIIIVPRSILFEQWKEEIEKVFGDDVFLYQYGNGNDSTTNLKIASSITGKRKIILSTIQTASNNNFINLLCQGNHLLLVIDEVHNSGSEKYSNLLTINVGSKIGLSATPKRYRDSIGTKKIFDFFGKVIDYPYSLENAIRDKSLCNYLYYPQKVELDLIEGVEYQELSTKIARRFALLKSQKYSIFDILSDSIMKQWLIQRSKIIKKAKAKILLTLKIIEDHYLPGQRWLIYCDDIEQLEEIKNQLESKLSRLFHNDLFIYHSKSGLHNQVLEVFERNGGVLLSINCLDEGVDIPSIDHALVLASSQNERQFIQRRGRVLRKHKNKQFAHIFDAIVSPENLESSGDEFTFLKYELKRAIIFAKASFNSATSMLSIEELAIKNNLDIEKINNEEDGFEDE